MSKIPAEAFKKSRGRKFLNFFIGESKQPKFGNTHFISVSIKGAAIPDFSKPPSQQFKAPASLEAEIAKPETTNQIPF